jgi:hypothetical protein
MKTSCNFFPIDFHSEPFTASLAKRERERNLLLIVWRGHSCPRIITRTPTKRIVKNRHLKRERDPATQLLLPIALNTLSDHLVPLPEHILE